MEKPGWNSMWGKPDLWHFRDIWISQTTFYYTIDWKYLLAALKAVFVWEISNFKQHVWGRGTSTIITNQDYLDVGHSGSLYIPACMSVYEHLYSCTVISAVARDYFKKHVFVHSRYKSIHSPQKAGTQYDQPRHLNLFVIPGQLYWQDESVLLSGLSWQMSAQLEHRQVVVSRYSSAAHGILFSFWKTMTARGNNGRQVIPYSPKDEKTTTKETYLFFDLSSEHFRVITYVDLLCTNNYSYVLRSVHTHVNIYVYKRVCKYATMHA